MLAVLALRLAQLAAAGDTLGMWQFTLRGEAVVLATGTRLKVIGLHGIVNMRNEMRVVSGPHAGALVWVLYEMLH